MTALVLVVAYCSFRYLPRGILDVLDILKYIVLQIAPLTKVDDHTHRTSTQCVLQNLSVLIQILQGKSGRDKWMALHGGNEMNTYN